jgi:hypothetical protein
MNISQPNTPNSSTITNQPALGPNGHPEPGGGFQGPAVGEAMIWISGKAYPTITIAQATIGISRGFQTVNANLMDYG